MYIHVFAISKPTACRQLVLARFLHPGSCIQTLSSRLLHPDPYTKILAPRLVHAWPQPASHPPPQLLQWSWAAWSADGLDLSSWYEAYAQVIGLVADPKAMKALVDKPSDACWSSVKTELGKVTLAYQILASIVLQHVHIYIHIHVVYT